MARYLGGPARGSTDILLVLRGKLLRKRYEHGRIRAPDRTLKPERSVPAQMRHGLTAETVIGALEDAEDYKSFEAEVTADFPAAKP